MAIQHGNSSNFNATVGFAWHQLMMNLSQKDVCIGCASKSILAAALDTLLEHENEADVLEFIQEELGLRRAIVRKIQ